MTATLEQLCTRLDEIAEQIQQLKANQPRQIIINAATIELAQGEHYAGIVMLEDGTPSHHVVLLPGDGEDLTFEKAQEWATEQGGYLPTRHEQSLLFANLKGQFQATYYWSGQQHETESSWAWYQDFSYGNQNNDHESYELRARAVRRLVIE